MATFADRLIHRMSELAIRQKDLAQLTGIKAPTINGFVSGSRSPSAESLLEICVALKCDPYWLFYGKGQSPHKPSDSEAFFAPIIDWADLPGFLNGNVQETNSIVCPVPHSLKTFAFMTIGEAMSPLFEPGDTLFIDGELSNPRLNAYVLVFPSGDTSRAPLLRQIQQIDDQLFYAALNKNLPGDMKFLPRSNTDLIAGEIVGNLKRI